MKLSRALMIMRKIFWSLRHDPRSIAMMLLAPMVAMCLFGIAFSGHVHDVEVVVVNLDEGVRDPGSNQTILFSEAILSRVDPDIVILARSGDADMALRGVEDGRYYAMALFPENFTRSIVEAKLALDSGANGSRGGGSIVLRLDRSQVNVASEIQRAFQEAVAEAMADWGFSSPVSVDDSDPVYGEGAEFIDMFVPGILGFVVFILTLVLTLITFVGERTRGTLLRLLATPVTEGEIVLGYAAAFSITGMVQVAILLGLAIAAFHILVVGNPLVAFLIASLLATVSVSLGILLSSAAHRESQAIQFFPLVIVPVFLLSGVFWPLESIPAWLRPVSYLIPVTYAIRALRAVFLKGWGVGEIWTDLLALAGFAVVFLGLAVLTLRREKR